MSQLKIGTLNLNGARDVRKRMMLYEFINQKSVDVMFIQETHSDKRNEVEWKREWVNFFLAINPLLVEVSQFYFLKM